jgi:hypothetical protein
MRLKRSRTRRSASSRAATRFCVSAECRHDRRAEDAGRQQDRVAAVEVRDEALGRLARVEADPQRVVQEAEQDDREEPEDRQLEAPVAAVLQAEDREGDDGGDQPRGQQRDVEEQVQGDGRADELGQIGRHRDQLGLHPQPVRHPSREVLAAQLRQVVAGRDADLRRQVLDQHRHQVGPEQDPQQHVPVLAAARDVGGEVARVDVGDAGDERRAQQRQPPADGHGLADLVRDLPRGDGGRGRGVDWGRHGQGSFEV